MKKYLFLLPLIGLLISCGTKNEKSTEEYFKEYILEGLYIFRFYDNGEYVPEFYLDESYTEDGPNRFQKLRVFYNDNTFREVVGYWMNDKTGTPGWVYDLSKGVDGEYEFIVEEGKVLVNIKNEKFNFKGIDVEYTKRGLVSPKRNIRFYYMGYFLDKEVSEFWERFSYDDYTNIQSKPTRTQTVIIY
jgi:hypothetical protein